jgi:hypothetical protein
MIDDISVTSLRFLKIVSPARPELSAGKANSQSEIITTHELR